MEKCPECGCSIKAKNLDKHIVRVHEIGSQGPGIADMMKLNRAEERDKLELQRKKKNFNKVFLVTLICIVVFGISFIFFSGSETNNPYTTYEKAETKEVDQAFGELKFSKAEVIMEPQFYIYNTEGVSIRYFAIKGSDGKVHFAFDACDFCWENYMGYRKYGTDMECNNCGKRFSINDLGTKNQEGECWPAYLPLREEAWDVYIHPQDILAGKYMFE